jgi:hypothetical protein
MGILLGGLYEGDFVAESVKIVIRLTLDSRLLAQLLCDGITTLFSGRRESFGSLENRLFYMGHFSVVK